MAYRIKLRILSIDVKVENKPKIMRTTRGQKVISGLFEVRSAQSDQKLIEHDQISNFIKRIKI